MSTMLCVDPGEDTGYSVWQNGDLVEAGTEKMWTFVDWVHDNVRQTDSDIAYMAGLLDGEGHVAIQNKEHPCARIQIRMTDKLPLMWVASKFGGNLSGPHPQQDPKHKPLYYWSTAEQKNVHSILTQTLPLLKVKQDAAKDCLAFLAQKEFTARYFFDKFVIEDWRIYPWEAKNLAWDQCRTARAIGALTFIGRVYNIDVVLQPAKIKERAQAAGAEEYYLKPLDINRHANDSIQHGVYFLAVHEQGAKIVESND